jgi:hypothetical protein
MRTFLLESAPTLSLRGVVRRGASGGIACVFSLLVLIASSSFAEDSGDPNEVRYLYEIYTEVGFPTGEFERNLDAAGIGLGGLIGAQLPGLPILLGLDAGFLWYGSSTDRFVRDGIAYDADSDNIILMGHFVTRWQPVVWNMRLQVEGLVGFKGFWTETDVTRDFGVTPVGSETEEYDAAFSYGVGIGTVFDFESFGLLVGARYLAGTKATFLKEGTGGRGRSRTDLVGIHIGLASPP